MSDFLNNLSQNKSVRKVVKTLNLPIPLPPELKRGKGTWNHQTLTSVSLETNEVNLEFKKELESFGAKIHESSNQKCNALLFDAQNFKTVEELKELYQFFHQRVRNLASNSRIVILGTIPESCDQVEMQAVQMALEGFVRSLSKEVGQKGSTANLIFSAENEMLPLQWSIFLLSPKSAFITGQVIRLDSNLPFQIVYNYEKPLAKQVALVTGAARGIGKSTAQRLSEEGAKVILLDRPEEKMLLEELAKEIGADILLMNLMDAESHCKVAKEIQTKYGAIDILVQNAGITRDKTLGRMSEEFWDQTLGINLSAVYRLTEELVQMNLINKGGRIVCLSSIAGIAGNFGQTNYSASKAGVRGLVKALSQKLQSHEISINAVAPGFIETRLTEQIPFMVREVARRMNSLKQGGLPIDVAEAITFLSLPQSTAMSGQTLRVCGGHMVGA